MRPSDRFATVAVHFMAAWAIIGALVGIPLVLISSVVILLHYGCWPMGAYGNCSATVVAEGGSWIEILWPLPVAAVASVLICYRARGAIMRFAAEEK